MGLERLEERVALSADPILTLVAPQTVAEGAPLSITDLGTFTDAVEGTLTVDPIGLDPTDSAFNAYVQPAFNPGALVTFDTTNLSFSGGASGIGTMVTANVTGNAADNFEIAVFIFQDFDLTNFDPFGIELTAFGNRPLAILSLTDMTIAGTINVSAPNASTIQGLAGPGGGIGGTSAAGFQGMPAAGAPVLSGGQLGPSGGAGGSGAGFGGIGGHGEVSGQPSGNNPGGIAYGDLSTAIQGGSGGSAGGGSGSSSFRPGGGGGGGIELGAVGDVVIQAGASILANGGNGAQHSGGGTGSGGGAGGGILIHGDNVTQNGTLSATGGNGGGGVQFGGGGGGGRIMIAHSTSGSLIHGGSESVLGGLGGGIAAANGAIGDVTIVAETPSSSSPIIETFGFVINWGDGSTADVGAATVNTPGPYSVGQTIAGSFDGAHTYADDGVYQVIVTLNDSGGGTDTKSFFVTVNNVAPTITATNLSVAVDEGQTALNSGSFADVAADDVTLNPSVGAVSDNGDGTWSWSLGTTDGPTESQLVTITATDEDGGSSFVTFDLTVNNVAPTADAGGPYRTLDDRSITLSGSGFDVAGAADPLTFEWDFNEDNVTDATGQNATFDPVALGIVGTSSVMVTLKVSDGDGGVAFDTATVNVRGAGSFLIDGTLLVVGSSAATESDSVFIQHVQGEIRVFSSFAVGSSVFNAADVARIEVFLRDGDDTVVVSPTVNISVMLDGGAGNDILIGGSGNDELIGGADNDMLGGQGGDDVLLGGAGNDDQFGGAGNDIIIAGDGADISHGGTGHDLIIGGHDSDLLNGGAGDDILIGGMTVYDDYDDDDREALDEVMAVWTSPMEFMDRVAELTRVGGLLESGEKVFDDGESDVLIGGAGRDLLFADIALSGWEVDFLVVQHRFDYIEPLT